MSHIAAPIKHLNKIVQEIPIQRLPPIVMEQAEQMTNLADVYVLNNFCRLIFDICHILRRSTGETAG